MTSVDIPTLKTDRLNMRGPTAADLQSYLAFYATRKNKSGAYRARTADDVKTTLTSDIDHWQKGFGIWLLTLDDSTVVGGAGLIHPDDWPSHELTWWLMPDHRGNGYAVEASRAAIDFGYKTLGWPQVETHMHDDNKPARQLAERLGGKVVRRDKFPDGVSRDVFALPEALQ